MTETRRFPWEFHGEVLTVDTPEQVRLELRIAPFGARIAAALIDRLVVAVIVAALVGVALLVGITVPADSGEEFLGWAIAVLLIAWFAVSIGYFVVEEIRGEGRTFGKRRIGLRSIQVTGRGLDPGAALLRNLARVVDELPPFWLVPALTPGNRRTGDLLAGTVVIVEKPTARIPARSDFLDALAPSWREIPERRFGFTQRHAERLHVDDLNLLEYLDLRLREMPPGRRRRAVTVLAERYLERLDAPELGDAAREAPERFLQELGLFLRHRFDEESR